MAMNPAVYITLFNFKSIIVSLELLEGSKQYFNEEIYKKPVFFLSDKERERIYIQRYFLKNPEQLLKVYQRVKRFDSRTLVYEGGFSRYHKTLDCLTLKSKYTNYRIPEEIPNDRVDEYRVFWRNNESLFSVDPNAWKEKVEKQFVPISKIPERIESNNSGIHSIDNLQLEELEKKIDEIIDLSVEFFVNNPEKQQMIRYYAQKTWLKNRKYQIKNKKVVESDEELREFLNQYDIQFKQPFKNLLLQYDMIRFNSELRFEGVLLEQLGFKPCTKCYSIPIDSLL
jgi:hypothetical protein